MGFFTLPTWSGIASISGRIITQISGSTFADGYPGIGLNFELSPYVFAGRVSILPSSIDQSGSVPCAFRVWYVDATHVETDVDATYDLLIPAGTTANYAVNGILPGYQSALCWGSGGDVTSNPSSTVRAANPGVPFGGNSFISGASMLTAYPTVILGGGETLSSGEYVVLPVSTARATSQSMAI
jgi:hypothetical protein